MLDLTKIRAIGLDLDDTLWPIWPTIERAELQLTLWLDSRAPRTSQLMADPALRLQLRQQVVQARPELAHDMSSVRRELIRAALRRSGDDPHLAEAAFEVFFEHRMRVDLYADALPALRFLAGRFPIVAISNGNADVARVGIGEHFTASLSAHLFGFGKPDARIFEAAAVAAGVRADEVLHIGDDPALDVLGALNAGMQTVWVNRSSQVWELAQEPHATVTNLEQLCALLQAPGRT